MALVLLYRFSESEDSILGFRLCQKLAQEGQDLYVTTTTPKNQGLQEELQAAERMSKKWGRTVKILEPQYEEYEEPNPEWIAKLHRTYFGYLSKMENIHTIIGTLPGTSKTAVDVSEQLKCKLVLLATTKIGTNQEGLKAEIDKSAQQADEIWSIGLDLFDHFQDIFKEGGGTLCAKHKKLLLQPDGEVLPQVPKSTASTGGGIRKVVSCWSHGHPYMYKGKRKMSKGSNLQNFYAFGGSLATINEENLQRHESKIQWHVHGLKGEDRIITSIREQAQGNTVGLVPKRKQNSTDDVKLQNCLAFIVPDANEETFNFIALSAIWQGVPTLVPSETSIAKFLLNLPSLGISCPAITRAVITLTGDIKVDKEKWIAKLYKEVLNHNAKPMQWAKELADVLHANQQLWYVDLDVFNATFKPVVQPRSDIAQNASSDDTSLKTVNPEHTFVSESQPGSTQHVQLRRSEPAPEKPVTRRRWSRGTLTSGKVAPTPAIQVTGATSVCQHHQQYVLNLFCQTCYVAICRQCKRDSHNSHKTIHSSERISPGPKSLAFAAQPNTGQTVSRTLSKSIHDLDTSIDETIGELVLQNCSQEQLEDIHNAKAELLSKLNDVKVDLRSSEPALKSSSANLSQPKPQNVSLHLPLSPVPSSHEPARSTGFKGRFQKHTAVEPGKITETHCNKIKHGEPTQSARSASLQASQQSLLCDSMASLSTITSETEHARTDTSSELIPAAHFANPFMAKLIQAKLEKCTDKSPRGSHLKVFSDVLCMEASTWICGWTRRLMKSNNDTVFLKVQGSDHTIQVKKKKPDTNANVPTRMVTHGNHILFAHIGGNEIFSFNTRSPYNFKRVYMSADLNFGAMCSDGTNLYVIDTNKMSIRVLNSHFYHTSNLATGIDDTQQCQMDMCFLSSHHHRVESSMNHLIIVSKSGPHGFVRALNLNGELVWQVDHEGSSILGNLFDPFGVSASASGDIFVADRGYDQIYVVASDGSTIRVLLNKVEKINKPTRVSVDRDGRRLLVVNRNGLELRYYQLSSRPLSTRAM